MAIDGIQVAILNHKSQTLEKFGRNTSALKHYQNGPQSQMINDLHRRWFGIPEACIIAHHIALLNDEGADVNYVIAVNQHDTSAQFDIIKPKGKSLNYMFLFFEAEETEARQFVFNTLRQTLLENHPVHINVTFKTVSFY